MRRMIQVDKASQSVATVLTALIIFWGSVGGAVAAEIGVPNIPREILIEIEYAKGLRELGLPDIAQEILAKIKHPAAEIIIARIQVENLGALGKFKEARDIIVRIPNKNGAIAWGMKLALADAHYAWGQYGEAAGIYKLFFDTFSNGPTAGLKDFYIGSAYKYAQMQIIMNNTKGALTAYRKLLKAVPKKDAETLHIRRQVLTEMGEIMVQLAEHAKEGSRDQYYSGIEEICNEILWVQDLWFGKAIVIMAHVEVLKGRPDKASRLIEDYGPQLKGVHDSLAEEEAKTGAPLTRLSPMAECRYLLGVILYDAAKKELASGKKSDAVAYLIGKKLNNGKRSKGALQHFVNVFIRFSSTKWAPEAGDLAREIEELLKKDFGITINTNVTPEQMEQVKSAQYTTARALLGQGQYKQAVEAYVKFLNLFPEDGDVSVAAVDDLIKCYMELEDDLRTEMMLSYLAERFCRNDKLMNMAGDYVIMNAERYLERERLDKRAETYRLFFHHFEGHTRTPTLLYTFGEERFTQQDIPGAMAYYEKIRAEHRAHPVYFQAMSKIAYCHSLNGAFTNEIAVLNTYIKELSKEGFPGHALVNAKFRLAYSYKQLGPEFVVHSFKRYSELVKMLSDGKKIYHKTETEREGNSKILEGSLFYKAMCYPMLKPKKGKPESYRLKQSIAAHNKLLDKFPKSKFAPLSLNQIATMYTILDEPDMVRKTIDRLQREYKDSPAAKNADFMLAMSLLKVGRKKQAREKFKKMFAGGGGKYSENQILTAGLELFKVGEYEIAKDAFLRVKDNVDDRARKEPAMVGLGRCYLELEKFADSAKMLAKVMEIYPKSGRTVEICHYISFAYAELGLREKNDRNRKEVFDKAVEAINMAKRFERAPGTQAELTVEMGRIMEVKAAAAEKYKNDEKALANRKDALSIYAVMILMSDASDPKVRRHVESAYHEAVPLLMKMEKWADALQTSDDYMKEFGDDGRFILDIGRWRTKAKIKVATGKGDPSAAGSGESEYEESDYSDEPVEKVGEEVVEAATTNVTTTAVAHSGDKAEKKAEDTTKKAADVKVESKTDEDEKPKKKKKKKKRRTKKKKKKKSSVKKKVSVKKKTEDESATDKDASETIEKTEKADGESAE